MTADHAEHFDPDCEECAYLARPTRETIAATPPAPGLVAALDNLATHHELERIAGNTHSRPDRCEFVEQALAALAASPTAPGLDEAWAEAEAALPEGTWIGSLTKGDRWHAQAFSRTTVPFGRRRTASASDDTPAAALLALAAALRGPVR